MTHFLTLLSKLDLLLNPPNRLEAWKTGSLPEHDRLVLERQRLVDGLLTLTLVVGVVLVSL